MIEVPGLVFFGENALDDSRSLIADKDAELIVPYAEKRHAQDAAWYAENRGGKPPTVYSCWCYKSAETAASQFMRERFGFPLVEPDLNIYESRRKRFDIDLPYRGVEFQGVRYDQFDLGVKSVNRVSLRRKSSRGESYVFQAADKVFTRPGNHWFAFVYVPHEEVVTRNADFYVRAVVSMQYLKDHDLFDDTEIEFTPKKYAVYLRRLRESLSLEPAVA